MNVVEYKAIQRTYKCLFSVDCDHLQLNLHYLFFVRPDWCYYYLIIKHIKQQEIGANIVETTLSSYALLIILQ